MTQTRTWALLSALALVLGVNGAPAQCPKEGCCKPSTSPSQTGSVIVNERNLNGTQCPASGSAAGEKCPDCDTCPGCYQKCPECEGCCTKAQACPGCSAETCAPKRGTFTIGVGFSLLPGPLPLPVPVLRASIGGGAGASCCPPVKACPAAAAVEESEEKEFSVETRLMEKRAGRQEQVLFMPKVTVLEGQPASVTVCGAMAQAGQRGEPLPGGMDGLLQVQVEELDSGNLLLDFTMQKNTVEKCGKNGTVIQCRRLAAIQEVKPGKTTKLVLDKDDQGGARTWVEVVVKDVSAKADAGRPKGVVPSGCYMPEPAPEHPYYGTAIVPPPVAMPPAMAPQPMTVFIPQPMPPQPAPMMPPAAVPCPRPVAELIPCNAPAVVNIPAPSLASVFRAIKEDGHARLEVLHGPFGRMTCPSMTWGTPGCKALKFTVAGERVHVSGDQVEGYANRVIADTEDRLVMEGQVRLTYARTFEGGAQGTPHRIKADKVTIHLQDGRLDVEMKTKSKD